MRETLGTLATKAATPANEVVYENGWERTGWCEQIYGCPDVVWMLYLILLPLGLVAFLVYHVRHRLWRRALATGTALLAWGVYSCVLVLQMLGGHQCKVNCSGVEHVLPGLVVGAIVMGVFVKQRLGERNK